MISSLVLLALGAVLVVPVYQGAVALLRQRLRQTQIVLERQEKLSSLGVLAAGIAHEIRNPLTSIKARLFTQQALLAKDSEAREDNQFITEEITRLEHIVRDFLAFARPTEPRMAALRAMQALRELAPLLEPELRQSQIELKEEFLADPLIHADPAQLKQVLINLVKNAADAIGADGTITLRTRSETQRTGRSASVRTIIEVEDTGRGIAPEVQKRLFDPFFTTKASGSGSGKELVARALYQHSDRAGKPFLAVNCAAIPETLLESELFGHERGAFTGADQRRIGRFEQSQGGTLFLDEIGDMTAFTQAKLLRVLQDKCIQRVGGKYNLPVDPRILAATHRDLEKAIQEKQFREDLYYRLTSVVIKLPPLRERAEDIPTLAAYFLRRFGDELKLQPGALTGDALAWLQQQRWPGNVRQLENVLREALLTSRSFAIRSETLETVMNKGADSASSIPSAERLPASLESLMDDLLQQAKGGADIDVHARVFEAI